MADTYEIQGRKVTLPCIVRDAGSGNAMYAVPVEAAQKILPGDAFEVVETAPGQTQLILAVIDYRDNDLGDYGEVGIIFMVRPKGALADTAGTFIYKLPVDQSFTCEAGCTIWGFPKTVEKIDFRYADDAATCRLDMDGQHVLTLTVPRGAAEPTEPVEAGTRTYTYRDGVPHETPFSTGGRGTAVHPGGVSAGAAVKLELGDHPIADELRSLGLPAATPIMSTWTEHMSGSFGPARKLD